MHKKGVTAEKLQMHKAFNCFAKHDPNSDPLCTLDGGPTCYFANYRKRKALVDCGAAGNLLPRIRLPDYELSEGEEGRTKVRDMIADCNELSYFCALSVTFRTPDGYICVSKFQVCDVHKPLLSVAKLGRAGYRTVLEDTHSNFIENRTTGERLNIRKNGNLYEVDLWVRPASFGRQGK